MIGLHDRVDVLVAPVLPVTVPRLDAERVRTGSGEVEVRAAMTPFTRPFNLTGQPALALPCGRDDEGLPIGWQIIGRPFDEMTVLRAGAAYERATAAGGAERGDDLSR
jgi:aspartyl-tRNA(Asn)/glutamyl-tRNA(Gln) amidotransferase subunit A